MPSLVSTTRSIWRALVPATLRDTGPIRKIKHFVAKRISHNILYDSAYFQSDIEDQAVRSAGTIADSILTDLKPSTAIDVGCGTGALLEALQVRGCRVFGLEYADSGLEFCRRRNLEVQKFDIERESIPEDRTFDVVISMEVAEHLAESRADRFVSLLTRLANRIVFTAAPPGQHGIDHVNEQPMPYWIAKFRDRGFTPDLELTDRWRKDWEESGKVAFYYSQNLLIFSREGDEGGRGTAATPPAA
jgi:SAM-dependent methyltransferase